MKKIGPVVIFLILFSLTGCSLISGIHNVALEKNEEVKAWYKESKQKIHLRKKSEVVEEAPASTEESSETESSTDESSATEDNSDIEK